MEDWIFKFKNILFNSQQEFKMKLFRNEMDMLEKTFKFIKGI